MALFQTTVVQKYLKAQDQNIINEKWETYKAHFHNPSIQENVRNAKEEQYQEGFLRDLFVNVLGYTLNPETNFNLTTELKNVKDAKKADGGILVNDKVVGVIELKGTDTTDLSKVETQAFGYKNNQKNCTYVITSNFEKLRFYIDNAIEHQAFDLFQLTENEFKLLYLCLAYENISKDIPKKLKNESLSQEDVITKQLYKDYSLFKRELFNNLTELNPDTDPLLLFKKSQKLLDRFLFLFFAEDRHLLPPNSVRLVLKQWKQLKELDAYAPLYNRYKKYFSYLNTGHKGKKYDVYPYNGGLFKPDDILDHIEIDDDLLYRHTLKLSEYDFDSEVDVNILGHIFENSLNEIEEIQTQLEEDPNAKPKVSKRKKDGVFYTPKYITKYIVENTVGKLCEERKESLAIVEEEYHHKRQKKTKETLLGKLKTYRQWLLELTIVDPACGSGAFLNETLNYLIAEHQYIDELETKLMGGGFVFPNVENSILENNLFGVDINNESVEIAKLSLWLRTAQPNRKLNDLSHNIKCGNSLIDDPEVAGDKAFNWETEFPKVFAKGGFDVVIGNPPYVRAELLSNYLGYFEENYSVYHSASDLFAYFYELGSRIINENGLMGYISNTFDKTTAGKVLREYLTNKISIIEYIDFTEVQIFDGATTYPVIIILKSRADINSKFKYIKIPKIAQNRVIDIDNEDEIHVLQSSLNSKAWSFLSVEKTNVFVKIMQHPNLREKYGKCYYGIKTALNDAFIINNDWSFSEHIKPIVEGREIKKWNVEKVKQKLILFKSKWTNEVYYNQTSEDKKLESLIIDFPKIFGHLLKYKERAIKRYDQGDYWWELRNCAYYDLFDKPKIIFPNLQNTNKFCFDSIGTYVNAPAVFLPVDNKALLCILNSDIIWEFLKSICVVRSGGYIEVKPQYFEQIPIPEIKSESALEGKANTIIELVNNFQILSSRFQNYISSKFKFEKLTRKLEKWDKLNFADFIKELNIAIKKAGGEKPTKKEEFEWLELFQNNKQKARELQSQITQTEKEINYMVYELYDLTEEEIKIMQNV